MPISFVSPGAEAAKAIRAELMLRAQMEQEAELLRLKQAAEERQRQMQEQTLAESIRSNKATEAFQQSQQEIGRVNTAVQEAGADTQLPEGSELLALARKYRPERVEARDDQLAARMPTLPAVVSGLPADEMTARMPAIPGAVFSEAQKAGTYLKPGAKYEEARQSAEERKVLLKMQATERARLEAEKRGDRQAAQQAQLELRAMLGQLNAGIAQQGVNVRRDAETRQQDAADAKKAETETAKEKARQAQEDYGTDLLKILDDLVVTDSKTGKSSLSPKAQQVVGRVQGSVLGGVLDPSEARQDALAAVDRLMGLLDVNTLREMKSQSRTGATGFGALSEKELAILESAAATLRTRTQSEPAYLKELLRIRDAVLKGRSQTPSTTGTETPEQRAKRLYDDLMTPKP